MKHLFLFVFVSVLIMIAASTKPVAIVEREPLPPSQFEPAYPKHDSVVTVFVEAPKKENRYSCLGLSDEDIQLLEKIVYLEARGESFAGQRMVAEVVLNRVLNERFPDTVREVIYQKNQFSPAGYVATTDAEEMQYFVVQTVLEETPITDEDVVFFARGAYNDKVWGKVGGHVFCRI